MNDGHWFVMTFYILLCIPCDMMLSIDTTNSSVLTDYSEGCAYKTLGLYHSDYFSRTHLKIVLTLLEKSCLSGCLSWSVCLPQMSITGALAPCINLPSLSQPPLSFDIVEASRLSIQYHCPSWSLCTSYFWTLSFPVLRHSPGLGELTATPRPLSDLIYSHCLMPMP